MTSTLDRSQLVLGSSSGPFSALATARDGPDAQVVFVLSTSAGELSCYHSETKTLTRLITGLSTPVHLAVVQRSAARVYDIIYSEQLLSSPKASQTGHGFASAPRFRVCSVGVRVTGTGHDTVVALSSASPKTLLSDVLQLRGLSFACGHIFFSTLRPDSTSIDLHSVEAFDCVEEMDYDEEITALFERSVGYVTTLVDRKQRRHASTNVVDIGVSFAQSPTDQDWAISVVAVLDSREMFTVKLRRSGATPARTDTHNAMRTSVWQPADSWAVEHLPSFPTAPRRLDFVGNARPFAILCAGAAPAGLATLSNLSTSETRGWQISSFRPIAAAAACQVKDTIKAVYFIEENGSLRYIDDIFEHNKLVRASWEAENARSPSARSPSRRAQRQLQRRQRKLNRPIGKDPTLDYGAGNGSFIVDQDSDGDSDFSSDDDTSPTESPTTPAVPSPNDSIVWYDNNGERKLVPRGSKGDYKKWLDDLMEASTFLKLGRVPQCNSFNVYLRCRPILPMEVRAGARPIVHCVDRSSVYVESYNQYQRPKSYIYDKVFGPTEGQEDFFRIGIAPLIYKALNGYNCTIFAYGQTGTGKTHTMQGSMEDPSKMGAIPRAVLLVMRLLEDLPPHLQWKLHVSHLEIYNEELNDLLDQAQKKAAEREKRRRKLMKSSLTLMKTLRLMGNTTTDLFGNLSRHNDMSRGPADEPPHDTADPLMASSTHNFNEHGGGANGGLRMLRDPHTNETKVHGLKRVPVDSASTIFKVLNHTIAMRQTHSTDMNDRSSRSHAIFTLYITIEDREDHGSDPEDSTKDRFQQHTRLNFVDLSGSENAKKSGSTGDRAREAMFINQGLLALGRVLKALGKRFAEVEKTVQKDEAKESQSPSRGSTAKSVVSKQKPRRRKARPFIHVPFRESKLTRFLEDSLGGDSVTAMVLTVSPNHAHIDEAVNTLAYANLATKILNTPQLKSLTSPRHNRSANGHVLANSAAPATSAMRQILHERIAHAHAAQAAAVARHQGGGQRQPTAGDPPTWVAPPWESRIQVRKSRKSKNATGVGGTRLTADADGHIFEDLREPIGADKVTDDDVSELEHKAASKLQAAHRGKKARDHAYELRFDKKLREERVRQKAEFQSKAEDTASDISNSGDSDETSFVSESSTEVFEENQDHVKDTRGTDDGSGDDDDDATLEADFDQADVESKVVLETTSGLSKHDQDPINVESPPVNTKSVGANKKKTKKKKKEKKNKNKNKSDKIQKSKDKTPDNVETERVVDPVTVGDSIDDPSHATEVTDDKHQRYPIDNETKDSDETKVEINGSNGVAKEVTKIQQFLKETMNVSLRIVRTDEDDAEAEIARKAAIVKAEEQRRMETKKEADRLAAIVEYNRCRRRARAQQAERAQKERHQEREERIRARKFASRQKQLAEEMAARKNGKMRQLKQRQRREATLQKRREQQEVERRKKSLHDHQALTKAAAAFGASARNLLGGKTSAALLAAASTVSKSKWSAAARRLRQQDETEKWLSSTREHRAAKRAAQNNNHPHIKPAPTGEREGWTDTYHGSAVAWAKTVFLDSGKLARPQPSVRAHGALLQIFAKFHSGAAAAGIQVLQHDSPDHPAPDDAPARAPEFLREIERLPMQANDVNTLAMVVRSSIAASGGGNAGSLESMSHDGPGSSDRNRSPNTLFDRNSFLTFAGFVAFAVHMARRDPRALQKLLSFCGISTSLDQKTNTGIAEDMGISKGEINVDAQQKSGGGAVVPLTKTRLRTLRRQAKHLVQAVTATDLTPAEKARLPSSNLWRWTRSRLVSEPRPHSR